MFYLTCTTITSVGLAHYGVSRANYWVSVDCGTNMIYSIKIISRGMKANCPCSHRLQMCARRRSENEQLAYVLNKALCTAPWFSVCFSG